MSLPKGHIEEGENRLTAAKREVYEESGIDQLEFVKDLGSYQRYKIGLDNQDDRSELKTIFMFLFQTHQNMLKPIDPNNPEARWVTKEEVSNLLTHEKDRDFFMKVMKEI